MTDGAGRPLAVQVTPGQAHESSALEQAVEAVRIPQPVGRPRSRPGRLAGDKGDDIPRVRQWLRQRGIGAVIPAKRRPRSRKRGRPLRFDREAYRRRNVIERCIGWPP